MEFSKFDLENIPADLSSGYYLIRHGNIELPIQYLRGSADRVVISFHGAVDRARYQIPKFQPVARDLTGPHQIRVADPTLGYADDISIGWYMGGEHQRLQQQLPGMLQAISKSLGLARRVYYGGSAGGFVALYCSWKDPESACLVINPQVDLTVYSRNLTGRYLAAAWPTRTTLDEVSDDLVLNLPKVYETGFDNLVVYLQSTADLIHFERQFPRFCRVGLRNINKFILQVSYWGVAGHGRSIPPSAFVPWMNALVSSDTLERQDVLDTYYALASAAPEAAPPQKPDQLRAKHTPADIRMASLLRDSQFRSGKGQ